MAGNITREEKAKRLMEIDVDNEMDLMWRELVVKVRKDIGTMTPVERANFFSKIIPYYKSKKEDVQAIVQWDLESIAAKYQKIRDAVEAKRKA